MKIHIVGSERQVAECNKKFGGAHQLSSSVDAISIPDLIEVVFDFASPYSGARYPESYQGPVFLDACMVPVSQSAQKVDRIGKAFGFCGFPTLINRDILEISLLDLEDRAALDTICAQLGSGFQVVDDQAGMVSPRIICMIINEAYHTLEEGIATREDIDLAMKLGTNYPWGPFEWADRIGLGAIQQLLTAALNATGDERYQVCPLLGRQATLLK
jgi:3-hydroxybutyryl-CoA dehydrogenase